MEGYVVMYRELLLCTWLTPCDKLVYTMLADRYDFLNKTNRLNEHHMMDISIRWLADQSGIDRRAIRKSLDKLCYYEIITEHKTMGGKSYYTVEVTPEEMPDWIRLEDAKRAAFGEAKKNTA